VGEGLATLRQGVEIIKKFSASMRKKVSYDS